MSTTTTTLSPVPRIAAGTPRRLRRTLTAAALAACVLPAAAHAGTVEQVATGQLAYRAATGEVNTVTVSEVNGGVEIRDTAGVTSRTPLCAVSGTQVLRCAIGVPLRDVFLGDGDDVFTTTSPARVTVHGESGSDLYRGGSGALGTRVIFFGGSGQDHVSYGPADRGVRVGVSGSDGRPGLDVDIVHADVERVTGSAHADELRSGSDFAVLSGLGGDDVLRGGPFSTTFSMGLTADGADRVVPLASGGLSTLDYSARGTPVTVTIGSEGADDGAAGERDEILAGGDFWFVKGGVAGDVIRGQSSPAVSHDIRGGSGDDRIEGGPAGDHLVGGAGRDVILGNAGDDTLVADDGQGDTVGCGSGLDVARLDSLDGSSGCETRRVGVLGVATRVVRADSRAPAVIGVRWRHPRAWSDLRRITLRLTSDGSEVGRIAVLPRSARVTAVGAARRAGAVRLGRSGRQVVARIPVTVDPAFAGRTLRADVEAVDVTGARQIERGAMTIQVAP